MIGKRAAALAVGLGISGLVLAGGPTAMAGSADGNGAFREPLYQQSGHPTGTDCPPTDSTATQKGFAIFNTPGRPGEMEKFEGEVMLFRAAAGTMYDVWLQKSSNTCGSGGYMTTLTTNDQGIGTAHLVIAERAARGGNYWVRLKETGNDSGTQYATPSVTLN